MKFVDQYSVDQELLVHIMIVDADYWRVKTTEHPVLGANPDKYPGVEFIMPGWT